MEWIGVAGILVALIFFVISAMRGYTVMITAPITAVIIILSNGMDVAVGMLDPEASYMTGLASFVKNNMLIFLFSAILGKYMDASGAAKTIANAIMKVVGKSNAYFVLIGVALVGAILTYGGVSMFVAMFALIPLARVLFKDTNLPWHLFAAAWSLGATSFTMAMIPGTPSVANFVSSNMTGVTMTSAPILGITATVIVVVLSLIYMKWALNRALAKGESYGDTEIVVATAEEEKKLPNLFISLLPLVILILIIIIGSALSVANIVYIGMIVAVVLAAILFHKYIKSQRDVLGDGAKDSLGPVLFTSAAVGVGSVIALSAGFGIMQDAIFNMPGGPLVSSAVLSGTLGGLTGSGSGALGIIANNFIDPYLATGVDPAILYKVMSIAATTGGALPNSGAMFGMLAAMGLSHKTAYKHIFAICVVIQLIALIVVIILGSFGIA